MELRRELLLTIGVLVLLNILLAFGAIGLFIRMGPAIKQILEDNLASVAAGEEILAAFASGEGGVLPAHKRIQAEAALQAASANVTEPEEPEVLESVRGALPRAFEGEEEAVRRVVEGCQRLIRINRNAMHRVYREARRLERAGAWAAVFVGIVTLASSFGILSRFRRRLAAPLMELHEVLEGVRRGEQHRRCRAHEAPQEIVKVLHGVNLLLDARQRREGDRPRTSRLSGTERMALLELLDRMDGAAVVLNGQGQIVTANAAAMETLAGSRGRELREALQRLASSGESPQQDQIEVHRLRGRSGWLCRLHTPAF